MQKIFFRIANSPTFINLILAIIVIASILVGLETYPAINSRYGEAFAILDRLILGIFIVEAVVKIGAEGRRPWRYFQDTWNVFDFTILVALLLPFDHQYFLLLRTVRLLRALRLFSTIPDLRIVIQALFKSIPSMGYVSIIMSIVFYIYGVAGTYLFGANDPVHFGSLQTSILTLFRVVTLEDWTDVMYIAMQGCDRYGYSDFKDLCTDPHAQPVVGVLFFVSFVVLGAMIVLNLFVGVIVSNTTESVEELNAEEAAKIGAAIKDQGEHISWQIDDQTLSIQQQLAMIQKSLTSIQQQFNDINRFPKS